MKMAKTTHIRIPIDLKEPLEVVAKNEGLSVPKLIEKMLLKEIIDSTSRNELFDLMPSDVQKNLVRLLNEFRELVKKVH